MCPPCPEMMLCPRHHYIFPCWLCWCCVCVCVEPCPLQPCTCIFHTEWWVSHCCGTSIIQSPSSEHLKAYWIWIKTKVVKSSSENHMNILSHKITSHNCHHFLVEFLSLIRTLIVICISAIITLQCCWMTDRVVLPSMLYRGPVAVSQLHK